MQGEADRVEGAAAGVGQEGVVRSALWLIIAIVFTAANPAADCLFAHFTVLLALLYCMSQRLRVPSARSWYCLIRFGSLG